ncbi:hypothetical protein [Streptomyces jumonjinensis]|uniref:hypothetical protein n=1 Tax=Streptomyces jumonjinensis TaxID=1945 RepID=UPI0037BAC29C
MHDHPYEITTHSPTPGPLPYRPAGGPVALPPEIQLVILPDGRRTLAYTHPAPAAPLPAPAVQPIPTWARTTALLTPTVGGGITAAGIGLSHAAPGLIAMSQALWSAAALIAAGTALPLIWRTTRGRGPTTRTAPAQITQNITATGLFGRANGTINH